MKKVFQISFFPVLLLLFCAYGTTLAGDQSGTWLGVYSQTVDKDLKEAFDLDYDSGAIIKQVVPDSPADKAGLKQGDIIIKLDNKSVTGSDDLAELVGKMDPGDNVKILIVRNGKEMTLEAELANSDKGNYNPGSNFKWFSGPNSKYQQYYFQNFDGPDTYIGLNLENLNDQLGDYFGVKDGNGILVTEVLEDSPAEKAGLKAGDVIIAADGENLTEIEDIQKAVQDKEEGDNIELTVLRDKREKEFSVEVAKAPDNYGYGYMRQFPGMNNFQFFSPKMKGMYNGGWDDDQFDAEENSKKMQNMQDDIKKLEKEIKELKEKLN